MKRSRLEIERLKAVILSNLSQGLTYSNIQVILQEEHKIPKRTFARYWKTLMKEEQDRLFEQKKDLLVGFMKRHERRMLEAQKHYTESQNRNWWYATHNADKDFMHIMGQIGVLDIKPKELDITLKTRLEGALEEARKKYNN